MIEPDKLQLPLDREFEAEVRVEERGTVITVSGELDVSSSHALERELAALPNTTTVVIDLRGLTFIDSTGLGVLVRAHQLAKEHGRRFGLVRGGGQVSRLLSLTGLDSELLIGYSTEQLLAGPPV